MLNLPITKPVTSPYPHIDALIQVGCVLLAITWLWCLLYEPPTQVKLEDLFPRLEYRGLLGESE